MCSLLMTTCGAVSGNSQMPLRTCVDESEVGGPAVSQ